MSTAVAVVDYGVGNLFSVTRALEACGGSVTPVQTADQVVRAERLVLPGVGAFRKGMEGLAQRGLVEPLRAFAATGRPFLGICLGMQMLLDQSEEFGEHRGLGIISGTVLPIQTTGPNGNSNKVPHIGWTEVSPPVENPDRWPGTILAGLPASPAVYFVHSYNAMPARPNERLADCYYAGHRIAAAIGSSNVWGCQFHPEKSGPIGLQILSNFLTR
jgi:imidazole glycerol-phosphate synthase subunit HisH